MLQALLAGGAIVSSLFGMHQQKKQADAQNALARQQMEFAERDYSQQLQAQQEWREKYGAIEHNMLKYVQSLDADRIYGLQEGGLRRSFERARQNMDAHLAERGLDVTGGVGMQHFQQLADQEAQTEAKLKQISADYVMKQQQAALTGHPEPKPSTAGMQNALGTQMNVNATNFAQGAAAVNDLETAVGRALRMYKRKIDPVTIDEPQQITIQTTTANTGRG